MKKLTILLSIVFLFSCKLDSDKKNNEIDNLKDEYSVSFIKGSSNNGAKIIVAYTNDPDSLWENEEWLNCIKNKMKELSSSYSTVLLFNNKDNMPNVSKEGLNYSLNYDKFMVCGYWIFPSGNTQFCYGGYKSDGNFKYCE